MQDLEQTLPIASCWLERPQPLVIPTKIKETEKELVELPDLKQLTVQLEEQLEEL